MFAVTKGNLSSKYNFSQLFTQASFVAEYIQDNKFKAENSLPHFTGFNFITVHTVETCEKSLYFYIF